MQTFELGAEDLKWPGRRKMKDVADSSAKMDPPKFAIAVSIGPSCRAPVPVPCIADLQSSGSNLQRTARVEVR